MTSHPFGYTGFECTSDEGTLQECEHAVNSSCAGNSSGAGVRCLPRLMGTCEAIGSTSCCLINCNAGDCWCDDGCYDFGDCCADIDLTCPNDSKFLQIYHDNCYHWLWPLIFKFSIVLKGHL